MYKLDNYHAPDSEVGVMYNDPALNINWNLDNEPTLSNRDQGHPTWDAAYKFTGLK
jgi:dTDP-4-dehydrorhamnose 3,5-epimerase